MLDFITARDFRESDYLENYTDVKDAVRVGEFESGLHHYKLWGHAEGKTFIAGFHEKYYLDHNPDVNQAVFHGQFECGLHHYLLHGSKEKRITSFPTGQLTRHEAIVIESINKTGIPLKLYKLLKH